MPSNHILVNNATECYVPDSKMEKLMEYLCKNAYDFAKLPIRAEVQIEGEATCCIQT